MKQKGPKKAPIEPNGENARADKYQISRSLPDLRQGATRHPAAQPTTTQEETVKSRTTEKPLTRKEIKYAPDGSKRPRKERRKLKKEARKAGPAWKRWLRRFFILLIIIALAVGAWVGWKAYSNSRKLGTDIWSLFDNSRLKGEDRGHVNILIAGNSADDPGHGGGELTDSIMVASVSTNNNTAFILSIPRDLYVQIPGYGYSKINAAYVYGEQDGFQEDGYPEGGMGLLQKTLTEVLGIPIDYYALINYGAFRDGVNAVGGITVTIDSQNSRGLYDPNANLRLPNGQQELNGETALNLARARGDGYGSYGFPMSDFDRTKNQRMMALALREKALSAGVLSNPIKIGNLFDTLGNNVQTDLTLGNMRRLATITRDIPSANITSASLNDVDGDGTSLLKGYTTRDGQSALIPTAGIGDYTQIQAYVKQLMDAPAPGTTSETTAE